MKACPVCGNEVSPRQYRGGPEKKYCSTACSAVSRGRKRRKESPTYRTGRRARTLSQYGLTVEQYQQMHDGQGGLCAICRKPPPANRPLVVDHCHDSGAVRLLLCHKCNAALGLFSDDPNVLLSAVGYLKTFKE